MKNESDTQENGPAMYLHKTRLTITARFITLQGGGIVLLCNYKSMTSQSLRIIDANFDRATEGLRVLEDIARFVLDDQSMSKRFKNIRHELAEQSKLLQPRLLTFRDSEHDVGANDLSVLEQTGSLKHKNLVDVVAANAKRTEQSLRVIEELSRVAESKQLTTPQPFQQARFALYDLEKELTSRLLRQEKGKKIQGLYVILDKQLLGNKDELEIASLVIEGGASIIQLRDKQSSKAMLLSKAEKMQSLCRQADVLFIINDFLDIALAMDADGIHIGQGDLPVSVIRKQLPIDKIIGCSARTIDLALTAQIEGADYISSGSIFPTTTKRDAIVIGIEKFTQIKQALSIPLVAIGGINISNIAQAITAGANSVAVISAILQASDIRKAVHSLVIEIKRAGQ